MHDTTFTVEFVTHCLATGAAQGEKDIFQRDNTDALVFQQTWWHAAISRGIEMAHTSGIKATDINVDLSVPAKTEFWLRRYGGDKTREHEAIVPGTKVTFNAVVNDNVTTEALKAILAKVGKYVGISPYGYRLGYGKFNVLDVKITE